MGLFYLAAGDGDYFPLLGVDQDQGWDPTDLKGIAQGFFELMRKTTAATTTTANWYTRGRSGLPRAYLGSRERNKISVTCCVFGGP
jgi:hypothetical protein